VHNRRGRALGVASGLRVFRGSLATAVQAAGPRPRRSANGHRLSRAELVGHPHDLVVRNLPPIAARQEVRERVRGIEPPSPAWKAGALPLSYTRTALELVSPASLSGREDLNLRPPAPKAGALPDCATPRRDRA
jgi:hypothetical protein